jgi:uncharacterized protein
MQIRIVFADSFFRKAFGLMFTRRQPGRALVFRFAREKRVSLHMFFVFYPIDVAYLDSSHTIVELKESLRPFTVYFPRNKACYVLELPDGYSKEHRLRAGDVFADFEV